MREGTFDIAAERMPGKRSAARQCLHTFTALINRDFMDW